jgi:hypothetical protein
LKFLVTKYEQQEVEKYSNLAMQQQQQQQQQAQARVIQQNHNHPSQQQ